MRISVPAPGRLSSAIEPPMPSMMFFAIARPRPEPVRFVVKYRIEDAGQVLSLDADAAIANGDAERAVRGVRFDFDVGDRAQALCRRGPRWPLIRSRRDGMPRVREDVHERRAQPLGIGHDGAGAPGRQSIVDDACPRGPPASPVPRRRTRR